MHRMTPPRWTPRVTVAAIIEDAGRFLLVEEHTQEGLRLNNPAGHLEAGETPLQAVVREALEETACAFSPEALLGIYLARQIGPGPEDDMTFLRVAFRGRVAPAQPGLRLDAGIVRTLWLTPQEIRAAAPRHRSPLLMRCIDDHLAGRSFALDLVYADPSLFLPPRR